MIKANVFLGLLAGFSAGTLLGALFASNRRKREKDKKDRKETNN